MTLPDALHGKNDHRRERNLNAAIAEMYNLNAVTAEMSPDEIYRVEQQIVSIWAESDPHAAAEYWVNSYASDDPNSLDTLSSIVSRWAEIDAQQALAFAQQLKNEQFRDRISGTVLGSVAGRDPQLAIALFEQIPPSSQRAAYQPIRANWQKTDVAATAAWISQLPEGMVGGNQGGHIAGAWVREDPIATADWLNTLPDGDLRDDAVRVFAMSVSSQDPEAAAEWVNTITDAELRDVINQMITRK